MQGAYTRVINLRTRRFLSRILPVLVFLCLAQTATAQPTVSVSPSVVLVLKLVSNTNVKPTTGIVISDTGLVLVSADFASSQGELIVLDGGTDILSNGRPARVLAETVYGKLAVISVEGLTRPGIKLSDNVLGADSTLHLEAFPPAGLIAKGAQPLWVPLDISGDEQSLGVSVSSETPLPYVSGAIVDHCGYLAGISLSSGPQSLETGTAPFTVFNKELARTFEAMQLVVPTANCEPLVQTVDEKGISTNSIEETLDTADTVEQTPVASELEPAEPTAPEPIVNDVKTPPSHGTVVDGDRQIATSTSEPPSIWRSVPLWLLLTGIIILGVLVWKVIFFFQLNGKSPGQKTNTRFTKDVQPASDEPVTAPLETGGGESNVKPRSAPVLNLEIPELSERPDGCNGVLLVEGFLDTETGFKRFCFVNTEQINIVIGRGDSDIIIEHAAISRAHLRVESDGELITLSDLGSRNGTFIGDVPCLPGEVMFFNANYEIFLGDVKLTISVVKQEAEWA